MQPKNGDFASLTEARAKAFVSGVTLKSQVPAPKPIEPVEQAVVDESQITIEELTAALQPDGDEQLEALAAKMRRLEQEQVQVPDLTDEELERQALEADGDDGNPATPE
jgi:hypothetical protein